MGVTVDAVHLARVSVQNFRAFESAELDFPATGLVFVVGANNSGKSALLSSLDVIAGTASPSSPRRSGAETPAEISGCFVLDEADRVRLFGDRADAWLASEAFREIALEFRDFRDERFYLSAVRASDSNGRLASVGEVQGLSPDGSGRIAAINIEAWVREDPIDRPYAPEIRREGGGVIDMLSSDLAPIAELRQEWSSRLYHFRALRTGTDRQRPLSAVPTLDASGINLAEALLYLFSQDDPHWRAISDVMSEALPDVGKLVTPAEGSQVEVAFIDPFSGTRRNIKDLGTGVEQFLLSAYVGVRQPPGGVVVIEEPETNLHAGAQRELLRRLRGWSRDRLYACSTHSSVFLDQGAEESLVYLVEREAGKSSVRKAETDLPNVLQTIGVRLSDVLSAERVLFVEGDTDAEILRVWLPQAVLSSSSAVLAAGGGDRAWQIEMVDSLFRVVDQLGRRVLFLRDRDEMDDASVQRLEETGIVRVLRRRELENYLLDSNAVSSVLQQRLNSQDRAPTHQVASPAEIDEKWRTTADALKPQVVLKNVAYAMGPIRPLDRNTVHRLVEGGPSLESAEQAVRENVPSADSVVDLVRSNWNRVARAIDEDWDSRWRSIAPGSELLEAVWKEHGLSYDKRRDGLLLANAIEDPPAELLSPVREFMTQGG
ncbi:MAG: AAA family ATPase [Actinobacteria bacterium]|nr:AAA family ATPase [Actinomycetota bacterium]